MKILSPRGKTEFKLTRKKHEFILMRRFSLLFSEMPLGRIAPGRRPGFKRQSQEVREFIRRRPFVGRVQRKTPKTKNPAQVKLSTLRKLPAARGDAKTYLKNRIWRERWRAESWFTFTSGGDLKFFFFCCQSFFIPPFFLEERADR